MLNKGRGLISLSQIEGGDTLQVSLDELIEYLKKLDVDQFRKVADKIVMTDLDNEIVGLLRDAQPYDDTNIRNLISNLQSFKADKSTVESTYRKKAVLINFNDLDEALQSKINAVVEGGYDDAEIKQQIQDIISTKLSKLEAENLYRDKNVAINRSDLDEDLTNIIDNWESQDEQISNLENTKADKADLTAYRPKNVAIGKSDLGIDVTQILDNIPKAYDDTHILVVLQELRDTKADLNSLALYVKKEDADKLYRLSSKAIKLTDLENSLQLKLKNIPNNFDPVNELQVINEAITSLNDCKAEKTDLANYRKKMELINESDLANEVVSKLNAVSKGYDDSALVSAIQSLQSEKLGMEVAKTLYRPLDTKIVEDDLSTEVKLKLNNTAYDDNELRSRIGNVEQEVKSKANKTELTKYRLTETDITENDLDDNLVRKINAISEGYNDTEVKASITNLEKTKADKTELSKYRLDNKPIAESELTDSLRDKVNTIANGYNDSEVKNRISTLEGKMPEKLSKTEAQSTYRAKTEKIVETDLSEEIKTKLNNEYNDTEIREQVSKLSNTVNTKLDKSVAEKTYRKVADKIDESSLSTTVIEKLNKTNSNIDTSILENYRLKSVAIAENDLDEVVKTKLNKTFDESKLNNYRLKSEDIVMEDLSDDLQGLIRNSNSSSNPIDKTAIINSLSIQKLLGLTSNTVKTIAGSKIEFKRGLFQGQTEADVNNRYCPAFFNYGNVTHVVGGKENPAIVRISSIDNGYKLALSSTTQTFNEGNHEIKLYGNGVHLYGLTNIEESSVKITAVNLTNSVTASEIYLNDGITSSKLNKAEISISELKKKPSNSKIEIPLNLPTNLEYLISGELVTVTLEAATTGKITGQDAIVATIEDNKMIIKLSDFITLSAGKTYELVAPTFSIKNKEQVIVTTSAPKFNFTFKEEVIVEPEPEPEPPKEEYDIDYIFTLPNGVYRLDLTKHTGWNPSWTLTDEDIYGEEEDCSDYVAELQYLGTKFTVNTEGKRVARSGVDLDLSLEKTPNGTYEFSAESGALITFDNASITDQRYRLLKRK